MSRFAQVVTRVALVVGLGLLCLSGLACSNQRRQTAIGTYVSALQSYETGSLEAALTLAERARQEDRRLAPAWNLSGRIRYLRGEIDLSMADLRQAVRRQPSSIDNRVWLVRALQAAGEQDEASQLLDGILADDSANVEALRLQASLALGRDDVAAAMQLLERAAGGLSAGALALLDRAKLLWAAGYGAAALDDLETARRLAPAGSSLQAAAVELSQRIAAASVVSP